MVILLREINLTLDVSNKNTRGYQLSYKALNKGLKYIFFSLLYKYNIVIRVKLCGVLHLRDSNGNNLMKDLFYFILYMIEIII